MGWLFCSSASGQGSLEDGELKSTEACEFPRVLKVQHVCRLRCIAMLTARHGSGSARVFTGR